MSPESDQERDALPERSTAKWSNLLIFGENRRVLKDLGKRKDVAGKVSLVYIDPPFATNQKFRGGNLRSATISRSPDDEIAYEDLLEGDEYLDFLRERLFLIRDLMSDNGSIYLHIDYKIGHYVKIVMDEVFGRRNFRSDISRIKSNPKNFRRNTYGNIKDLILFYSKSGRTVWNEPRRPFTRDDLERLFRKKDSGGRRYTTTPLHAPGETENGKTGQKWRSMLPPDGRHWRYPPEELEKLDRAGLIEWSGTGVPRKIIYADEYEERGMKMQDVWEFKDPQYPEYPTEKNLDMLKLIVGASSNPDDIVLDAFCGSGTTILAAEALGRRWIGIDNSRLAISTTRKRLERCDTKAGRPNPYCFLKSQS